MRFYIFLKLHVPGTRSFKLRIDHFSKNMHSFSKRVLEWAFIFKMWFFFKMGFHFQNVKVFRRSLSSHLKFSMAHGQLQIPCGTRSFKIFCGTRSFQIFGSRRSFQIPCGTRSSQISCGTRSFQIFCGTLSFQIIKKISNLKFWPIPVDPGTWIFKKMSNFNFGQLP